MGILDTLKGLFTKGKGVVDANGDGQVGLSDIQSAAQNLPETLQNLPQNVSEAAQNLPEAIQNLPESVSQVADVNGDGQVNLADAQQAAQNVPETLGNVAEQAQTAVEDLKNKLPQ